MPRSIDEIVKIKARERPFSIGEYEVDNLAQDYRTVEVLPLSFTAFVPIRLVTIIEASVRGSVAKLIDSGEPYVSLAAKLLSKQSGKTLEAALLAVSRSELTVGTLVSFGFTVGRLEEIFCALEILLGQDVKRQLIEIGTRWTEPERNTPGPVIKDEKITFRVLQKLFEARHIVVHEVPANPPYSRADLDGFIEHAKQFVSALNWLAIKHLQDTVPYTQTQMNLDAAKRASGLQKRLDELRGGSTEMFISQKCPADEIEYHWDKFADLSAKLYAGLLSGEPAGSIGPMLYAEYFGELTQWRIDLLERGREWNAYE
jgi:hypothetical protein